MVSGVHDELVSISRSLRKKREFSMYGDEGSSVLPEEVYTKIDAEKILSLVNKLFSEFVRS